MHVQKQTLYSLQPVLCRARAIRIRSSARSSARIQIPRVIARRPSATSICHRRLRLHTEDVRPRQALWLDSFGPLLGVIPRVFETFELKSIRLTPACAMEPAAFPVHAGLPCHEHLVRVARALLPHFRSRLAECEQVVVDLILEGGAHPVRSSLIDLQVRVLHDLC